MAQPLEMNAAVALDALAFTIGVANAAALNATAPFPTAMGEALLDMVAGTFSCLKEKN
jgi:hypothetical protein